MRHPYHDIYNNQFENLIVVICQELLGIATQGFSTGPDGGRDARFQGVAQNFVSKSDKLSGKFIIQAKHTEGIAEKFSDKNFSSTAKTSILSKEIEKVKIIREAGEVDHYLLFSNRRISGGIVDTLVARVKEETGVKSCHLMGSDNLDLYLKRYPDALRIAGISPIDVPLRVSPDDLADIIDAFVRVKDDLEIGNKKEGKIERVKFKKKNQINKLSKQYEKVILEEYLVQFSEFKYFLANPGNSNYLDKYKDVVAEFKLKIIEHRGDYEKFEKMLNYIIEVLFKRDYDLRSNKHLTRAMVFYMYWNCDIGEKEADA